MEVAAESRRLKASDRVNGSALARYLSFNRAAGGIPSLDGLRAVAILLVLFRHGVRAVPGGEDVLPVFTNGWAGVDLFFVLSGFLVFHTLIRRWEPQADYVRSYIRKRILRIVPAYYASLLFFSWWYGSAEVSVAYHLLFLQDLLPANIIVAFWSLGVEEKFYLLAPIVVTVLLKVGSRRTGLVLLLGLALVSTGIRSAVWFTQPPSDYSGWFRVLRSPFYMSFDSLFMGAACAWLFHRWPPPSERVRRSLAGVGAVSAGLLLGVDVLLEPIGTFNGTVLTTVLAVVFAALLLGVVNGRGWLAGKLSSPYLYFFSKLSYSLYLVHMALMAPVWTALTSIAPVDTMSAGTRVALYLPLYSGASILAALVLHYAIEKPFLIRKDRLESVGRVAG